MIIVEHQLVPQAGRNSVWEVERGGEHRPQILCGSNKSSSHSTKNHTSTTTSMPFNDGTAYHADSDADADDEFERSMTSPTELHEDSESDSEPSSNEPTPTFGNGSEDPSIPRTIITDWTAIETSNFLKSLGLRQYSDAFLENEVVGEALVALRHDELKELGMISVGHRITLLKAVFDTKIAQGIPIENDAYIPQTAAPDPTYDYATKEDAHKLARSILKLRDDRIVQLEDQLMRLADDYRRLRQELLPVFKMAKESSEPLPHFPAPNPETAYQQNVTSPPSQTIGEKVGLARTFSKKLFLGSNSTPKTNSPTHLPNTIHEGRTLTDSSSLDPSAAATVASNSLTASMSGGSLPGASPSIPSPTSPYPYAHQSLAPTSYRRDGSAGGINRYDGADDRANAIPTPPGEPPNSGKSNTSSSSRTAKYDSTLSTASTVVGGNTAHNSLMPQPLSSSATPTATPGNEAPSVEIFKSFRVSLEDPCYKVLPAALKKYNINADWRQYALYIVYGDQERCVGLQEKPLALFKDLDREGKKPMFMLRKLAGGDLGIPSSAVGVTPLASGATISSAASIRTMQPGGTSLPGGVL